MKKCPIILMLFLTLNANAMDENDDAMDVNESEYSSNEVTVLKITTDLSKLRVEKKRRYDDVDNTSDSESEIKSPDSMSYSPPKTLAVSCRPSKVPALDMKLVEQYNKKKYTKYIKKLRLDEKFKQNTD